MLEELLAGFGDAEGAAVNADARLVLYVKNQAKVLKALQDGRVEYMDLTSWKFMDYFFGYLFEHHFFDEIGDSYPDPRRKKDIPVWFLIAAYTQLKCHNEEATHNLTFVLRSGTILNRVSANLRVESGGFNNRNKHPRKAAINQDTARKFFKRAKPAAIMEWFNRDVVGFFSRHDALDKEAIAIVDSTFLPVTDNPNYTEAAPMPLDKHGHLVDLDKMSEEERKRFKWTPCFRLTTLLHTTRAANYFMYLGAHLGPGDESELKAGEKLVDDYMSRCGEQRLKLLIEDRGFIDGPAITRFKQEYHLDVLIPLKKNMDAYKDVMGLVRLKDTVWVRHRRKETTDAEGIKTVTTLDLAGIHEITSWDDCKVPLSAVLCRETVEEEGKESEENIWILVITRKFQSPGEIYELYELRTQIEERHKQLKLFWNLGVFTSPNFALVTAHVFFILLAYSALQWYLRQDHRERMACRTIKTLQYEERLLQKDNVIIYAEECFGTFRLKTFTRILLDLKEAARRRLQNRLEKMPKDLEDVKAEEEQAA